MNLECPNCGFEWDYTGNNYRVGCRNCGKWFRTGLPTPWENKNKNCTSSKKNCTSSKISDDIMRGNIIDALEKADVDPWNNNGVLSKDFIPLLLKEDKLKFAFSKYCMEKKKQPTYVVKKAIIYFLKEEKYYEA